jgi:large subunit ribosomal protein L5
MIRFWCKSVLRVDSIYKINLSNSQKSIKIDKITINMCLKSIIDDPKTILYPLISTRLITNQTPSVCKARKSVALLKLRKGMLVGTKVALRGDLAFNFLSLFILIILPNNKDFNFYNINDKGCLSIGLKNLFAFPQLSPLYDKFPKDITGVININLNTKNKKHSMLFYTGLSIPFKRRIVNGI